MKYIKVQKAITKAFPSFNITSISKIGEGWDNRAFLLNESWIFRFPKTGEIRHNLKKEVSVMPLIRKAVNLAVPQFEYVSQHFTFAGYQKLAGSFFTIEYFEGLSKRKQQEVVKQMASFLATLHQFKVAELQRTGLEEIDYKKQYSTDFLKVQEVVYPELSKALQHQINTAFHNYLSSQQHFTFTPSLLHNDFSSHHLLYDPATSQLTGVIDFGDMAIGDPAYDFMYLYEEGGAAFIRRLLDFYPVTDQEELFGKLRFFQLADTLLSIIHGLETKSIREVRENYRLLNGLLTVEKSNDE